MAPFYILDSTVSRLQSCYEETVFFTIQLPGVPGAQAEMTLEPTSGFEPRTSGLDIIYFLNKYCLKLILCVL